MGRVCTGEQWIEADIEMIRIRCAAVPEDAEQSVTGLATGTLAEAD